VIDSPVRVRPLRLSDEAVFVAAHRAMAAEHFTFGLCYADGMSWSEYLDEMESHRRGGCHRTMWRRVRIARRL
jgi:hypothetical protein